MKEKSRTHPRAGRKGIFLFGASPTFVGTIMGLACLLLLPAACRQAAEKHPPEDSAARQDLFHENTVVKHASGFTL